MDKNFNEEKARKIIKEEAKKIKKTNVKELVKREKEIENLIKGLLKRYREDIKILLSLLKDFISGKYRKVPWFTIAAITTSLIYILNPFDAIPDFIPVIGQTDDAIIISVCLKLIEKDIERYKNWKNSKGRA